MKKKLGHELNEDERILFDQLFIIPLKAFSWGFAEDLLDIIPGVLLGPPPKHFNRGFSGNPYGVRSDDYSGIPSGIITLVLYSSSGISPRILPKTCPGIPPVVPSEMHPGSCFWNWIKKFLGISSEVLFRIPQGVSCGISEIISGIHPEDK